MGLMASGNMPGHSVTNTLVMQVVTVILPY